MQGLFLSEAVWDNLSQRVHFTRLAVLNCLFRGHFCEKNESFADNFLAFASHAFALLARPHPQYSWDFPEESPEKFRKDPGNALRAFPGIALESTAGIPQALQFKALEGSRALPEFSPPQYGWGRLFFQKWFRRGSLRAGHGIPSSTGGISD